jgi:hypothetical protein
MVVVDQQSGALVAQPGARSGGHAHPPISANLTACDAQSLAQIAHQRLVAQHAVCNVVAEQNAVLSNWLGMKETIEPGDALHMGQGQAKRIRDVAQGFARQPALKGLKLTQYLNQRMWGVLVTRQQCR